MPSSRPGTTFNAVQSLPPALAPTTASRDPEFGGVGRWGDYSNGEVDPSGNFWLATQYIPNNGDEVANWGNRIFEIVA